MPAPKTLSERRRALSLIRIPMVVVLILAYMDLLSLLVAATVADEEELADEEKVADEEAKAKEVAGEEVADEEVAEEDADEESEALPGSLPATRPYGNRFVV